MPLYSVSTQSGVLTGEAKAALAEELTAFHCAYLRVPCP
jgi:phenylpyruvate tautomerase PptA (4-oxalocrotonate tautomerase family)